MTRTNDITVYYPTRAGHPENTVGAYTVAGLSELLTKIREMFDKGSWVYKDDQYVHLEYDIKCFSDLGDTIMFYVSHTDDCDGHPYIEVQKYDIAMALMNSGITSSIGDFFTSQLKCEEF